MKKILILLFILFYNLAVADPICSDLIYVNKTIEFKKPEEVDTRKTVQFAGKYRFLMDFQNLELLSSSVADTVDLYLYYGNQKSILIDLMSEFDRSLLKKAFDIIPRRSDFEFDGYIDSFKSGQCSQEITLYNNNSEWSDKYTTLLYDTTVSNERYYFLVLYLKENTEEMVGVTFRGFNLEEIEEVLSTLTYRYLR